MKCNYILIILGVSMSQGGQMLRALRLRLNDGQGQTISLERLAEMADISYEGLSNIERGKTKAPSRAKIMKILDALASFCSSEEHLGLKEKNVVLEAFGYTKICVLPHAYEQANVVRKWELEYKDTIIPSYLIDITQHILCWNTYSQKTSGIEVAEVEQHIYSVISNYTIFDIMFSKRFAPVRKNVLNQDGFFSLLLSTIKSELIVYQHEQWYIDLIHETTMKYPEFALRWNKTQLLASNKSEFRFGPILINYNNTILTFTFQSVLFDDDPRFRSVQYLPCDSATIDIWNQWVKAEKPA